MTNLGIAGAVSLNTINQWISVIDTNLNNSKRIGYKETTVSFTAGEVGTYGTTHSIGKIQPITFPSASLQLSSTTIRNDVQGNLTPTGQITDFALGGKGYFVVEDMKDGRRYATRDGQFNFDTDGYLVTAEGLRVLTTGFDYFRVPASEQFSVNSEGESESNSIDNNIIDARFNPATGVSSLSTSIYGNRKLLVVDLPTQSKLVYSKYGYTKFDLGTRVPVVIKNDFSETMDGIAPYLIPDALNGTASTMASFFKHDVQNGLIKMATRDTGGITRYVQAAYSGQKYMEFNTQVDFNVRKNSGAIQIDGSFSSFGITFGKTDLSTQDNNAFYAGIINNKFVLTKNGVNLGSSPANLAPPINVDNSTALTDNPALRLSIKLDVSDGVMRAQLLQNGTVQASINIAGYGGYSGGYMSIGTSIQDPNIGSGGSAADNVIDITSLNIVQRSQDSEYTTNIIQKNNRDIQRDGLNASYEETQVRQQFVEESTTTLADTLPLLSYAQKMFGAVSKIISTYNTMTDDMNNIIR